MLLRREQESAEKGEPFAKGSKKKWSARNISCCARNDGRGEWITHVPYKGYVGKTPLPQRHPERSRGIFFAHRYSAVCETVEKGKPFAKGARKSRAQGRFLAALEMTVWGMGLFHVAYNEYVWKALFLYRHPERSRGIFLAEGDNVVCVIAEKGKTFAKGARKSRVRGIFLDFARNDGMGDG